MRSVQIYINNERLDLFQDEKITVSSSVQNINDISKVYTDFSQSFTVPASKANNKIFGYYYNNDLDLFEAKKRQPARIEIDFTPFKTGKIQLEGAEIINNEPQNYRITFYGEIVTLKDLFGDDKLKDLTYDLEFERTGANVIDTISNTNDLDVRFPLISSDVVWNYGTGGVGDISNSTQAIDYTKLFPAVKTKKVIEAIEDTYGISFNGNFLNDKRFTNLFTWWKHKDDAEFPIVSKDLEFDLSTGVDTTWSVYPVIDTVNEIHFQYIEENAGFVPLSFGQFGLVSAIHKIGINITNVSAPADVYYIDTYKNGTLVNTNSTSGNASFTPSILGIEVDNVFGLNDVYTFKLRGSANFVFDFEILYYFDYIVEEVGGNTNQILTFDDSTNNLTVDPFIGFDLTAPDIKVSDYFSGLLKMFNLTCYPISDNLEFEIEPLEDWYNNGDIIDITKYVDVNKVKVDRPKLYRNIEFSYQKSKSFINEQFLENNNRDYGSLKQYFGYDGGDFKIDLPFETIQFNKFTSTDLQVAYSLDKAPDFKPVVPKATMLYLNEEQTGVSFWVDNGTAPQNLTSYIPFGQEIQYNSSYYSINFNQEISSLTLQGVSNSLYNIYYLKYLSNLFSNKTRIVTVKTILPLRLLNYISLDDALVIRDKKYRINDMKTDLTTGEVELVLITDFTSNFNNIILPILNSNNQFLSVPIKPPKSLQGGTVTLTGTSDFVSFEGESPLLIESETIIEFQVSKNTTDEQRQATFNLTYNLPYGKTYDRKILFIQNGFVGELATENNFYLTTERGDNLVV